jgi:hypothetical protein
MAAVVAYHQRKCEWHRGKNNTEMDIKEIGRGSLWTELT